MAKRYRRYRALYDFQAREDSELSINFGDTLTVAQLVDGSWPHPERWMKGFNEVTQQTGEFPGSDYVEFIEEFVIEPEPPPPLLLPSPRHASFQKDLQKDFQSPALSTSSDTDGSTVCRVNSPQAMPHNLEEAPPTPPPRRGSIGQKNTPRPCPRIRKRKHNWMTVTFGLPVKCGSCEL